VNINGIRVQNIRPIEEGVDSAVIRQTIVKIGRQIAMNK
jgi:hypothetical protein